MSNAYTHKSTDIAIVLIMTSQTTGLNILLPVCKTLPGGHRDHSLREPYKVRKKNFLEVPNLGLPSL